MHRHIFRQDTVLYKTDHTVLRILVKFSWHIPDFPIYSDGTKPGTLHKAYNSLNHLWRNDLLFVYLKPPKGVLEPHRIKSTTNSLEGGINAQLKLLARTHRGRRGEHQRKMLDWWLYLKTELPGDPIEIARQSNWGQNQLAKVTTLTRNENQADYETGQPALYDNGIDTEYTHSIGIQKGHI